KSLCRYQELFARVTFLAGRTASAMPRGFMLVGSFVSALGTGFSGPFCFCFSIRVFLFGGVAHGKCRLRLLCRFGLLFFFFLFRLLFDARKLAQNFDAFLGCFSSSRE